jgi:uncharacterized protein
MKPQPRQVTETTSFTPEQIEDVLQRCGTTADWAAGFFAAVHTGPNVLAPSAWVPSFTPEAGFTDNQDATTSIVTLLQLYNQIGNVMSDKPEALCPDPEDEEGVEDFCSGYVAGIRLHEAWRTDKIAMSAASIFAILGGLVPREELKDPEGQPWPDLDEWLQSQRVDLGDHVNQLWKHWAATRKGNVAVERQKRQVGRNDPCPCGSGKKYKKCCLAA